MGDVLVINAGSSSIKFALFGPGGRERLRGEAAGIGEERARLSLDGAARAAALPDHEAAIGAILSALAERGIAADSLSGAGHRVVHGGARLTHSELVTPEIEAEIEAVSPLAPLHNPHALKGIRALRAAAPGLRQVAVFDTAFHATNPEVARRYAIPDGYDARGFRRYGFHGISYESLVAQLQPDLPRRLLALHLGNGASLCAIREGKSVATTMGYSPLDGLTMGTRSGSIDPAVVLALARELGADAAEDLLNRQSGLLALAGTNDMAALLARDDDRARFAVDHFCYWAARHAGSMIAAMGGHDAIAFTGGIGENAAPVRERIAGMLSFMGEVPVLVVPAREEWHIASETMRVLAGAASGNIA
ncbi:MAG: acetate/propionate family kinase [Alphaproteobacteria bacterium]|nr:MAG: acetate/propionate family kinase [Alphaproteobacteria bacterium]